MRKRERRTLGFHRNVFTAGLVSLFMDISSEMIYPLIPLFLVSVLGTSKATIGLIEGIAESTASLLKVFSGWISDRLGKRKLLMVLGYGISALSRPVIALSGTWGEVLTARFIDRFGKGIRTSPRDAIIADSTETFKLGRAFGFHRAMDTLGATIGPGVAFFMLYLFSNNFRLVFWLSAVPAVIAVLLIILFLSEGFKKEGKSEAVPEITITKFGRRFRRYILVITIFSLGNTSDVFLILKAREAGISEGIIPVLYLLFNLVYSTSSLPMGFLADRFGSRAVVASGFIYYSLIYLGLAFADRSIYIWIIFCLYGIFRGMSDGVQRAYLAGLAPLDKKATAFGIYHMAIGLSLLPASIIGGLLWDSIGPEATFLYGSMTAFIAFTVMMVRNS